MTYQISKAYAFLSFPFPIWVYVKQVTPEAWQFWLQGYNRNNFNKSPLDKTRYQENCPLENCHPENCPLKTAPEKTAPPPGNLPPGKLLSPPYENCPPPPAGNLPPPHPPHKGFIVHILFSCICTFLMYINNVDSNNSNNNNNNNF